MKNRYWFLNPINIISFYFIFPLACIYYLLKRRLWGHSVSRALTSVYALIPYFILSRKNLILGITFGLIHIILGLLWSYYLNLKIKKNMIEAMEAGDEEYIRKMQSLGRESLDSNTLENPLWTAKISTRKVYISLLRGEIEPRIKNKFCRDCLYRDELCSGLKRDSCLNRRQEFPASPEWEAKMEEWKWRKRKKEEEK